MMWHKLQARPVRCCMQTPALGTVSVVCVCMRVCVLLCLWSLRSKSVPTMLSGTSCLGSLLLFLLEQQRTYVFELS